MRFIVYGAGGIGGAMGAFIHASGQQAALIARGEHLRRVHESGLTVVTPEGPQVIPVPAAGHPSELLPHPDDCILLTMKSQDTEQALRDLRDAGWDSQETPIFCVQNGIANERTACRYFEFVYGVMITIPGVHLEPGVVHNPITGNHGYLDIGRYPRGVDGRVDEVVGAIRRAGYAATADPDVMAAKGAKFLGNLGNAIGAITDGRGDAKPYMERVRTEAEACFTAAGLPFEDADAFGRRVRENRGKSASVEGVTNRGSSWQSLMRGQGTIETDFLNGEVVLLGRLHGIATPFNAVLQRVASEMARSGEKPGRYTAEELWEMAVGHRNP